MLRLIDVALLRAGRLILDRATLAIDAGELLAVHGPRSAGKSSLCAIAVGALRPASGRVEVAGRDVMALQSGSLPYVRRNISYLPANPPLIDEATVLWNVMLALAVRGASVGVAEDEARAALDRLGILDVAQAPVEQLSSGERRLCALARALTGQPPLVVLDEPAAALSPEDCVKVAEAIHGARAAGAAVLCCTADAAWATALVARGGRAAELRDGRITGGAVVVSLVGATRSRRGAMVSAADQGVSEDQASAAAEEAT